MKALTDFSYLYLYRGAVDFRKSINGLSAIVQTEMGLEFRPSSLFIFCNGRRSHMKILYYDKNGFCLWLKRLEGMRFPWPQKADKNDALLISLADMKLILDGINIWNRFKEVHFETVL